MNIPNKSVNGYVAIVLSAYSSKNLLKEAGHQVLLGKEIVLAFAPTEPVFETNFKALVGQEIVVEVMTTVADERGKIAMIRLPVETPSFQTPFIAISTAEGVSPDSLEDLVKRGLKYPIESDDIPMLTLGGVITFVPFMSAWATEIAKRQAAAAEDPNDDSFIDRAPSTERSLEGAPKLAAPKSEPKIVASYGPSAHAPGYQVIGARRHYRTCSSDVLFDLNGWECTDKKTVDRSIDRRGFISGPFDQGPWKVKMTKASAKVETATATVSRTKDGINLVASKRTIALEETVGRRWLGRYRKVDRSLQFGAVYIQCREGLASKTENWTGPSNGYDSRYQSITAGGVKINLVGSKKGDLSGVYRVEIKAKVLEYRLADAEGPAKTVVTYMVTAYRLADGVKPTQRLYLESGGREVPEGAQIIQTAGQCQIVVIDLNKPQIMPSTEPTPVTAK